MLFKSQRNSWIFFLNHRKSKQIPRIFEREIRTEWVRIRSCKNSWIFWSFCKCAFLQLKRETKMCWLQIRYRCSRCPDFHQKIPEFYAEWLRKASDGDAAHIFKGKIYLWRGRCIYEGEDVFMKRKCIYKREDVFMKGKCIYGGKDVFMKGKMYLCRGRCTYEGEDVFMKVKMYLWKGRCIYEAKMCLWRGRCIYEEEDVFIKEKNIYEGRKKNPGIFEEIKNKIFFKNQSNSWIFFIAKVNKFREFLKEKSECNVWESVLAKIPGFFEAFATARFYNSKGKRRCADCRFVTDAIGTQISIKKSRNFMRNGWGKPPMEIPHSIFAIRRYRFYGIINILLLY